MQYLYCEKVGLLVSTFSCPRKCRLGEYREVRHPQRPREVHEVLQFVPLRLPPSLLLLCAQEWLQLDRGQGRGDPPHQPPQLISWTSELTARETVPRLNTSQCFLKSFSTKRCFFRVC